MGFSMMLWPAFPTDLTFTEKEKRDAGWLARKGADVLADRLWAKGAFQRETKSGVAMCAVGALFLALCGNAQPRKFPKLVSLTNNLFGHWHNTLGGLPTINDDALTTKQDVIDIMRKFADEFDPQG